MIQKRMIPSVNFHLWQPCNMKCGFCFARFYDVKEVLPKGHLTKEKVLKVVELLADYGFEKITFVGGEPTLCPWIKDLIKYAKSKGMTTMIVTNGTKLTETFLEENKNYLDWIGISMDSLNRETNEKIGRVIGKKGVDKEFYDNLFNKIKNYEYKIKINTVVNKFNFEEDMSDFIEKIDPLRWKLLKVLPIRGQNDKDFKKFEISDREFSCYIQRHQRISSRVKEDNNDMTGSYIMVDPSGRFFDNTKGEHTYSSCIIDVGVERALEEIKFNYERFERRNGNYNW